MENTFEQLIWDKKFPNEEFNADDFYDLIAENPEEYLKLALEVGKMLISNLNKKSEYINFLNKP